MAQKYRLKNPPENQAPFRLDYSNELNPAQYEVVTRADGPCLVLAGAGSGKTRTLIWRVAYLLEKGIRPEEILLVTFTNKAAGHMKNRVESLLKTKAKGLWCGTFHHVGHRSLRLYARQAGLSEDFGILDEEDSRDLLKSCLKTLPSSAEGLLPKPAVIQSVLSFSVNAQIPLAEAMGHRYPHLLPFAKDLEKIKQLYNEKKKKTHHVDYDDLLLKWLELLESSPEAHRRFSQQFRYCLVDEYQDTNRLQHEIMKRLSSHHRNVLVVGDDAQSIYSFRAAEIKNILEFPKHYKNVKIFKLETNYRSTRPILDLANQSIRHNAHQFPKTLRSLQDTGPLPKQVKVRDTRDEAAFVVQRIRELQADGFELSQTAVLFRAHYQAAELELELTRQRIPYVVRGGIRFFEQAHIKDVLSFLKIIQNPLDELAWTRVLLLQPGIGPAYAERIFQGVEREKGSLKKILAVNFMPDLPSRVREGLGRFKRVLKELTPEELLTQPDRMITEVLENGYKPYVLLNFENAQDRLEDLKQLANFAHTYRNVGDLLRDVTLREGFRGESLLDNKMEEKGQELILSTIHQAKGLEWHAVFMIGLCEGLFPHAKAMGQAEQLEEERRLFYVGVTRAKEELFLVHPMTRYDVQAGSLLNRPSLFVSELPPDTYEEIEVEPAQEEEETIYRE